MLPLALLLSLSVLSTEIAAQSPTIVILDSGHDPENQGSTGTCGKTEMQYNDEMTMELHKAMSKDRNYKTVLTRKPGQPVEISSLSKDVLKKSLTPRAFAGLKNSSALHGRAAIANASNCDLFVSIHHDSTLADFQEGKPVCEVDPVSKKKTGGVRLSQSFKDKYEVGYSVLILDDGSARAAESRKLAAYIAKRIKTDLKRTPSNYHGRDGDCLFSDGTPDCRDVNPELGIIHRNIAVLRETRCPAVLVEVGNIVDGGPDGDEGKINNDEFRGKMADAIKAGIDDYLKASRTEIPIGGGGFGFEPSDAQR